MKRRGKIWIGISGWTYARWRGQFYPKGLRQSEELAYAASIFRSIEINGSFYRLQTPDIFARWAAETPRDFVFAVKAPRFLTHVRRLRNPAVPLANFLASGLLRLGPKLGPVLWQFPPSFRFDAELLDRFLHLLPHDTEAAATQARRHDGRLKARAWLRANVARPLRHAIEVRHVSFRNPQFIDMLREHDVALVCADTVDWPRLMDITSDFIYCRLHGSEELYRSAYTDKALKTWATRVPAWSEGNPLPVGDYARGRKAKKMPRDVFVYFDNTDKLQAPADAQALMRKVE